MQSATMMEPPSPSVSHSELDRLVAAVLVADPAARIMERATHVVVVALRDRVAVFIEALDAMQFARAAEPAFQAMSKGRPMTVVGIDFHHVGIEKTLLELAPKPAWWASTTKSAYIWELGTGLKTVRGKKWPLLEQALKRLHDGDFDASQVVAQRSEQGDALQRFMEPLAARKPVVTYAIAALSIVMFGLQELWGNGDPYLSAPRMGGSLNTLIAAGEWWRLLSPMLLHGSIVHIVMNMLALFSFGTFLEKLLGWRRYLVLYVLSGLGGSIASALRPSEVLSVGASGGIWGLMLAGAALVTFPRGKLPALVVAAQGGPAWAPVLINFAYSFKGGIDMLAHLGGGLIGGLLIATGALTWGIPNAGEPTQDRPPLRESPVMSVMAAVAGLAVVASLAMALVTGRPWELNSTPRLSRVAIGKENASIELPLLMGERRAYEKDHTYVFGVLGRDPITVAVVIRADHLDEAQAADPRGVLEKSIEGLRPKGYEGFTLAVDTRVSVTKEGRPFLYTKLNATDGRVAQAYWLVQGDRFAEVTVFSMKQTPPAWLEEAALIPFSLNLFDAKTP